LSKGWIAVVEAFIWCDNDGVPSTRRKVADETRSACSGDAYDWWEVVSEECYRRQLLTQGAVLYY
jgi:hypothetical protein